jgi:hypothetical protein
MRRTMAMVAAAALFAAVTPAPASAAVRDADCVPTEEGCLPWSLVDENTELYLTPGAGGQMQGFRSFANFANHVRNTMGVGVSADSGTIQVSDAPVRVPSRVPSRVPQEPGPEIPDPHEHPSGPDSGAPDHGEPGDEWPGDEWPGDEWPSGGEDGGGPGWAITKPAQMADYAMFYDRPDWTGAAFIVMPKNSEDLTRLRHPFGGPWDGRVSAISIFGGQVGKPGVQLCADLACAAKKPIILWNNTQLVLPPQIGQLVSRVSVFAS